MKEAGLVILVCGDAPASAIGAMAERAPVWTIDLPGNRVAVEAIRAADEDRHLEVTVFALTDAESKSDDLDIVQTVLDHHPGTERLEVHAGHEIAGLSRAVARSSFEARNGHAEEPVVYSRLRS